MAQKRLSLEPIRDFHVDEGEGELSEGDTSPVAQVRKHMPTSAPTTFSVSASFREAGMSPTAKATAGKSS